MAIGYVLISTSPAKEHDVYNKVKELPGFVEGYRLQGEYDVIAKIVADDFYELGKIVIDGVRAIEGLIDTKTLTGIKF